MTIEEIRKNAPDGVTHYLDCADIFYYKRENGLLFFWNVYDWSVTYRDLTKSLIPL
ncbi:MAG: hypothetical protein RSC05_04560 [Acinetobacter sp.]